MNIKDIIEKRRTIRKFSQEPVQTSQLKKYVELARLAPSGANLQPIKYKIVTDKKTVSEIFDCVRWAGYIAPEGNPKKGEEPTAYICVMADTNISKTGHEVDMGAAVATLILAAEADDVGSCWMQAIDYKKIPEILNLPENLKLMCVVAMGKKAETPVYIDKKDDIKYFKDENGTLNVPKRTLEEVLVD